MENKTESENLCIREYNFYKGFNYCSILFDNFFKKTLNITNDIHPYTDLYMIFSYNKKHNYKDVEIVWDPIIHSFQIKNKKYVFHKTIKNILIDKMVELAQKYLDLDKLWDKKLEKEIINNYIQKLNIKKYNIDTIFEDSIVLLKKKMIPIYNYYCVVRNDFIPTDIKKFQVKYINNVLSFVADKINDKIDIEIHPTRYKRLQDLFTKHNNKSSLAYFNNYLYALVRRNRTIYWQYKVFFGNSIPQNVFNYWRSICSNNVYECFADPFNCYLDKYYSAFHDVDKAFGSLGSFFDNPPKTGCAIAHPPTEKHFLEATIKKVISEVKKNKVVYILGMPIWPAYMRVKGQNLLDKYDKFKINREMTLHTANLDTDINETKTYYYKYELYIIGSHKFDIKTLESNVNKQFVISKK